MRNLDIRIHGKTVIVGRRVQSLSGRFRGGRGRVFRHLGNRRGILLIGSLNLVSDHFFGLEGRDLMDNQEVEGNIRLLTSIKMHLYMVWKVLGHINNGVGGLFLSAL